MSLTEYVSDEAVGEYLAASDLVMLNYKSHHIESSGACALAVGAGGVVATSLAPSMLAFGDAVWHMTSGYPPQSLLFFFCRMKCYVRRSLLKRRSIAHSIHGRGRLNDFESSTNGLG